MTTPLDNLMPIGATLHPHTSQNFFKIGPGEATTITAPTGALTVAVTWEGEENLYLWAERDGKPIRVIARDRTGGGRILAEVGSLTSCVLKVSADNHSMGDTARRGTIRIVPTPTK